jgi:hypothetical protein
MLCRLFLLTLLASATLPAWTFTYSDTTTGAPFWFRPDETLTSVPFFGLSRYQATSFVAPTSGTYYITSAAAGGWDNFIVLYQNVFNAATPLANAIAANDNFGGVGTSALSLTLVAGTQYHLVTTGFWLGPSGAFTNTITDTPEPATWLLIAFGCAALFLRRQLMGSPVTTSGHNLDFRESMRKSWTPAPREPGGPVAETITVEAVGEVDVRGSLEFVSQPAQLAGVQDLGRTRLLE